MGRLAIEIGDGKLTFVIVGRDGEGLPRPFGVIAGDFRGMDVNESFVLEELMDSLSLNRTDPIYSQEGVGPGTKVGDIP